MPDSRSATVAASATVGVPARESDCSSPSPSRSETSDEVLRKAQLDLNRRDSGLTCMGLAPGAKLAASVGGFNNGNPNAKVLTRDEIGVWKTVLPNETVSSAPTPHDSADEDMYSVIFNQTDRSLLGFLPLNCSPRLEENGVRKKQRILDQDLINIKLGDIVPTDARLLEGDPLKIDQATLTGVSLPFTKNPGDETFSGPTCKQSKSAAVVMATGMFTFFGKAAYLFDSTRSLWPLLWFQKVLTAIGHFYIYSIIERMLVGIIGMYPTQPRHTSQMATFLSSV
ncbi:hypothetical protein Nepgr_020128 [Nepenthes gracilis]|uniref:P-type ATPase A domain-containing protein n=1 Tax=Nepenthes gracilis TaxID=150966 RepID=A0AAD3SXE5_NEPGR|nr:hypothetical protein Nepgr_020128 [Nepenthes gracilis]